MPDASLHVHAIILAAGQGSRFGGSLPKQFQMLRDEPVVNHSMRRLARLEPVKELVLVLHDMSAPDPVAKCAAQLPRPVRCVAGGRRRQDSVAAGLRAVKAPCDVILIHDGARPFPPLGPVIELVTRTHQTGGGLLAVPCTDTVKLGREDGTVESTLDRSRVWLAQTPQAVRFDHAAALADLLSGETEFTDEASAMESMGIPVVLVEGASANFKITRPEDLRRAVSLLTGSWDTRTPYPRTTESEGATTPPPASASADAPAAGTATASSADTASQ